MTAEKTKLGSGLRIRQIRSVIGYNKTQKATVRALGLGRIGSTRVMPDNPQVRAMVGKISHLVRIVDEADES